MSGTDLRIVYSHPKNDGGDDVTEYLIEWDTSASFDSNSGSPSIENGHSVTSLGYYRRTSLVGGSPYSNLIQGLSTGVSYYFRVSAYNSQV